MAKIRVYELAKELNMTNKQLLDRMREIDIQVKTHMSALEDDVVEAIKASISKEATAGSEDGRSQSTVIRRRRTVTKTPSVFTMVTRCT